MTVVERITFDSEQCGGKPCVRHMRIRVSDVLGLLSRGLNHQQGLQELSGLEAEDILACLEYAAQRLDHPQIMVGA